MSPGHGSEKDGRHEGGFGATLCPIEYGLEVPWSQLPPRNGVADGSEKGTQFLALLLFRRLVDTVGDGELPLLSVSGDNLIREDHELLDQAVRIQLGRPKNVDWEALLVEYNPSLGEVEIERSPLLSCSSKHLRQSIQLVQSLVGPSVDRLFSVENLLYLLIVEPMCASNPAPLKAMLVQHSTRVENQEERERQPVLALDQRTGSRGECVGKHRDDLIH
jgi:hypothetical protein